MRFFISLLALGLLVLVGAFPVLGAALVGLVALAVSGAVTLLAQPPILLAVLVTMAAMSARRRFA
jgi:hypothetical protein